MKKNLAFYLSQLQTTEKFSNFEGNDFSSNDMGFDAYNMGAAGNCAPARSIRTAKPYTITYTNTTAGTLNAVLFGYNKYFNSTNYGTDAAITVSMGASTTYAELVAQSMSKPFTATKFRFVSSTSENINQEISLTYKDADGRSITDPIPLAIYFNTFQQATNKVDVDYEVKIDGTSSIAFTVAATSSLQIIVFADNIADHSDVLTGGTGVRSYATPVLSGTPILQVAPKGAFQQLIAAK